jgi:hypothetical protein
VVSGRRALAVGVMAVFAYAGLAFVSGALSLFARGPLLDGLGPAAPYRWVDPPAALAEGNRQPESGSFEVRLGGGGSRASVFLTPDAQVTVIVPKGAFDAEPGQIQVELAIDPVDPASLSPPGDGLHAFGNAYRLTASYVPSGDRVPDLAAPLDLILLYPVTPDLTSAQHRLATSTDGTAWTEQEGTDAHAQQQAEGPMRDLGYVMVVGRLGSAPSAGPSATGGGSGSPLRTVLLVAAVCIGLLGAGLVARSRRS